MGDLTYTFPPDTVLARINLGDGWKDMTIPAGTYSEGQLDAYVRLKTGGQIGIETSDGRERKRLAEVARLAGLLAEWEDETRSQRADRQEPRCIGWWAVDGAATRPRKHWCGKRPARRGPVPGSGTVDDFGGLVRPLSRWLCWDCWLHEREAPPDYSEDW